MVRQSISGPVSKQFGTTFGKEKQKSPKSCQKTITMKLNMRSLTQRVKLSTMELMYQPQVRMK